MLYNVRIMPLRIVPDQNKPSAAIEIPLEKPLLDYDLEELEQPTPRDVDAILVSQGFRDLVDDARGVLTDLLHGTVLEITQLTGAICPGDDEVYRPGLWIVVREPHADPNHCCSEQVQEQIAKIAHEFANRMGLS
jgi:hypothetical protein